MSEKSGQINEYVCEKCIGSSRRLVSLWESGAQGDATLSAL